MNYHTEMMMYKVSYYNKCNNLCLNYTGELQDTDDRTISSDDTEDEVGCNYETESM